jgi:DNA-binding transcriptional LysR family regulator
MIQWQISYLTKRRAIIALLLVCSIVIGACSQPANNSAEFIEATAVIPPERVGLADSADTLIKILDEAAKESNFSPNIAFIQGNDETLVADVTAGRLAAALVYSLPPETPLWFNPIALDGLTIIGHQDNPLNELPLESLPKIFQGQLTNWAEVGGANLPISVFIREAGSGVQETFRSKIQITGPILATALVAPGQGPMITSIQQEKGAIGLSMMASSEGVKSFSISGIQAIPEKTSTQEYPLTVPLYFVSQSEPEGELRAFLSWLQSSDGQSFLGEKYGRVR